MGHTFCSSLSCSLYRVASGVAPGRSFSQTMHSRQLYQTFCKKQTRPNTLLTLPAVFPWH